MVARGRNERMAEMSPRSVSQEQPAHHENGNRSKLCPRGDVLEYRALLHTENIDQRLQGNGSQRDQVSACDVDEAQRKNDLLGVQCRKSLVQVGRKSHAQRSHSACGAYGEIHPAIEEACCISVGFTYVNVLASGVGRSEEHT